MKYRKRPIVIEAVRWNGTSTALDEVVKLTGAMVVFAQDTKTINAPIYINTLEGEMRSDLGDWIIKGIAGECYPCKPDIFEATYEPVE